MKGGRVSPGPQTPLRSKEHSYPCPVQQEPPSICGLSTGLGDSKADGDLVAAQGSTQLGVP